MSHQIGIKLYYENPLSSVLFCFQGELFVGDQSGAIHIWDLKTDHNEQLVKIIACIYYIILILRKEKGYFKRVFTVCDLSFLCF